jgi:hypothetical protein
MIGGSGDQGTGPITPHKKPPGGELTAQQMACNYRVNRFRAAAERAIRMTRRAVWIGAAARQVGGGQTRRRMSP